MKKQTKVEIAGLTAAAVMFMPSAVRACPTGQTLNAQNVCVSDTNNNWNGATATGMGTGTGISNVTANPTSVSGAGVENKLNVNPVAVSGDSKATVGNTTAGAGAESQIKNSGNSSSTSGAGAESTSKVIGGNTTSGAGAEANGNGNGNGSTTQISNREKTEVNTYIPVGIPGVNSAQLPSGPAIPQYCIDTINKVGFAASIGFASGNTSGGLGFNTGAEGTTKTDIECLKLFTEQKLLLERAKGDTLVDVKTVGYNCEATAYILASREYARNNGQGQNFDAMFAKTVAQICPATPKIVVKEVPVTKVVTKTKIKYVKKGPTCQDNLQACKQENAKLKAAQRPVVAPKALPQKAPAAK